MQPLCLSFNGAVGCYENDLNACLLWEYLWIHLILFSVFPCPDWIWCWCHTVPFRLLEFRKLDKHMQTAKKEYAFLHVLVHRDVCSCNIPNNTLWCWKKLRVFRFAPLCAKLDGNEWSLCAPQNFCLFLKSSPRN